MHNQPIVTGKSDAEVVRLLCDSHGKIHVSVLNQYADLKKALLGLQIELGKQPFGDNAVPRDNVPLFQAFAWAENELSAKLIGESLVTRYIPYSMHM